ncbi:MAG: hypothetical protein ACRENJ_08100 [Candidatus Eiseniibacteriota bacterium]
MRHPGLIVVAAFGAAACCLPVEARSEGHVSVGAMLWRHETNLKVERATDYDGSDMTASERALDWDVTGSGLGARVSYEFPRLVTVYGEAGTSQATVRDKDVSDPSQQVSSRGLDSGAYFAVGATVGDYFSGAGNTFWRMAGSLSAISAGLDRDVFQSWDYDETRISGDLKVGTWVQQVGFYGGLRLTSSNADLRETDRSNLPGEQSRVTELGRDSAVDLLVGAQTRGPEISGFTEIGMVGTFSATAGLTLRF